MPSFVRGRVDSTQPRAVAASSTHSLSSAVNPVRRCHGSVNYRRTAANLAPRMHPPITTPPGGSLAKVSFPLFKRVCLARLAQIAVTLHLSSTCWHMLGHTHAKRIGRLPWTRKRDGEPRLRLLHHGGIMCCATTDTSHLRPSAFVRPAELPRRTSQSLQELQSCQATQAPVFTDVVPT